MSERSEDEPLEDEAIIALAAAGNYDQLEAAWMGAIEADTLTPADAVAVLRAVAAREAPARTRAAHLESLAWFLLSDWPDRKGPEAALDVARAAADLLPDSDALREQVAGLYRRQHASFPAIEALTELTLLDRQVPLAAGVGYTETALRLPPGTFVRDSRRRSAGRVVGIDAVRKGLEVSFGESGKVYDAASLGALERVEADDFRGLVAFEPVRAAAMARDDPEGLVLLALKAHGPRLALQDLRAHLEPVVPPADWSRWWKAARPLLNRASEIEMTEGSRPDLILRTRPMTFEDQVRRDFEALASAEERLLFVLNHLAEPVADSAAEVAVLKYLAGRLGQEARSGDPAAALGARAVLAEVRRHLSEEAAGPEAPALAAEAADVSALLRHTENDALAQRVLGYLREVAGPRWAEAYAAALPDCSPGVAKWVARELLDAGQEAALRGAVAAVLARPAESAGALVWVWRSACGEKPVPALSATERYAAAAGLLTAAGELKRAKIGSDETARRYLGDVQRALAAKEFAILRSVLQESDEGQARGLRVLAARNSGLTDLARLRVLEVIREAHPILHAEKHVPPWEEDVVYTTEEALHAQQKEFEDLVHGRMAANSAAISRAAAHGDLSENAEFTAALEERDRLVERAGRMQQDLAKVKVIRRSMAEGDHVTVGSRVVAKDLATGKAEELAFLGPWDAAPERGVYYYRTALGLAFMGKAVGDTVVMQTRSEERRWEIAEIRPAL